VPKDLAELLVEEGAVSAGGVAQALERQREAGGSLDTALLELGLLDEASVVDALARASGLSPASPEAYAAADARARRVFPAKVAERHGLAPVALDGRDLRLVAAHPVDLALLDEISFMLSLHLSAQVGPEFRVRSLIHRLYGGALAPRLAALEAARGAEPGVAPAAESAGGGVKTGEEGSAPAGGAEGVPAPPGEEGPAGWAGSSPEPVEPLAAALAQAVESGEMPLLDEPVGEGALAPADRSAPPRWSLEEARAALAAARGRDQTVLVALRYARDFFEHAALFAVTRDAFAGHDALGLEEDARDRCRATALYAADPGILRTVIETRSTYLGPVARDAPGTEAVLDGMCRGTPRTVLLYPVLLRDRPVCVLYADNGDAPVSPGRLGDLLLLLSGLGAAFERILRDRKARRRAGGKGSAPAAPVRERRRAPPPAAPPEAQGPPAAENARAEAPVAPPEESETASRASAAPPEPPPAEIDIEVAEEPAHPPDSAAPPAEAGRGAAEVPATPEQAGGPAASGTPAPDAGAGAEVESLAASRAGTPARSLLLARLVERGAEAVGPLVEWLPGPIEVDPDALDTCPAEEQGPLLAALVALGSRAGRPVAALLSDADAARRRAAAAILARIAEPSSYAALAERVFDADSAVRRAARAALAAHRRDPKMRPIPEKLRRALLSGVGERPAQAARALGGLRDVESIPSLIQVLETADPAGAEAAATALTHLTLQRLGTSPQKWLAWWKENRGRGRADWLFSGLASEDRDVRVAAAEELGEGGAPPVPYSPDLPPGEREKAARAWASWWARSGKVL
jgi:HEAT repeat protein